MTFCYWAQSLRFVKPFIQRKLIVRKFQREHLSHKELEHIGKMHLHLNSVIRNAVIGQPDSSMTTSHDLSLSLHSENLSKLR